MFYLKKQFKTTFYALSLLLLLTFPAYAANYTVVPGDALYKIASLFKTTISTITKNNNLYTNTIYPGQVLKVPADIYTVKEGDSLYLIATRYGLPLGSLRKANGIWINNIYSGQKLIIPVSSSVSPAIIPYTSSDLDLLARLITAESVSEPYNAQAAVGAVVINRVRNSGFPNTISGVIYQKDDRYYQFTPVENGWINKPATATARNAAYDALHGYDPSKGAIYYFDDSATNTWLWSRPIALRSGHMVFTY